jgi:hypothetical protein
MKHFKVITCSVLRREMYFCAARSINYVEVVLLPQGLHNTPDQLRVTVQQEIDRPFVQHQHGDKDFDLSDSLPADKPCDGIILGYPLCCNGTVGLIARDAPLIIPRAHDCISIMLGSAERYLKHFNDFPGNYWFSAGWMETCLMPGKQRYEKCFQHYLEKYGEDNAKYLMEVQEDWYAKYSTATFIRQPEFPLMEERKSETLQNTEFLHWNYKELEGNLSLIQRMLDGVWDEKEVLVVPPNSITESDPASSRILTCKQLSKKAEAMKKG